MNGLQMPKAQTITVISLQSHGTASLTLSLGGGKRPTDQCSCKKSTNFLYTIFIPQVDIYKNISFNLRVHRIQESLCCFIIVNIVRVNRKLKSK